MLTLILFLSRLDSDHCLGSVNLNILNQQPLAAWKSYESLLQYKFPMVSSDLLLSPDLLLLSCGYLPAQLVIFLFHLDSGT